MRRLACHCACGCWRSARCPASRPTSTRRRRGKLARNRLAVSARRLAGGPRVPLRGGRLRRAVEVYVRPKIGFCNCDTGVADDDEVDRVADLDLMSERFAPREAGKVIRVADMPGRIAGL